MMLTHFHACSAWQGFRHGPFRQPQQHGLLSVHMCTSCQQIVSFVFIEAYAGNWFMSLPSGTAQAEQIKLRKTCRGCKQPLYGAAQDEDFAVAGVGIMHLECAKRYCLQQGMALEDAVPICKHWHLKGLCIYQVGHNRLCITYHSSLGGSTVPARWTGGVSEGNVRSLKDVLRPCTGQV